MPIQHTHISSFMQMNAVISSWRDKCGAAIFSYVTILHRYIYLHQNDKCHRVYTFLLDFLPIILKEAFIHEVVCYPLFNRHYYLKRASTVVPDSSSFLWFIHHSFGPGLSMWKVRYRMAKIPGLYKYQVLYFILSETLSLSHSWSGHRPCRGKDL